MLLDLLSQIEPDDSWRGSYPDWFPRTTRRAIYPTGTPLVVAESAVTAAPASGSGVITNRQLQYQQIASPLPTRNLEATAPSAGIALARQFVQYQAQAFPFSAAFVTTPAQPYLQSEMPIRQRLLPTAAHPTGSFGSEPTVNPFWTPTYPDRLFRVPSRAVLQTVAFTPSHEATEGKALDWWARYPDRFLAPTRPEGSFAFWPFPLPSVTSVFTTSEIPVRRLPTTQPDAFVIGLETEANPFAWEPQYPDRLWSRRSTLTSDLTPVPAHNPSEGFALDWKPTAPDWFPPKRTPVTGNVWISFAPAQVPFIPTEWPFPIRRTQWTDQWLAFTPAHESTEGNALDWTPVAPGWLARPQPWQDRAQMSVFYPFPFAPFNPAVARFDAVYPDWISRVTLRTATVPFFVPGPFVPIPNPPVTNLPKDLHLGTIESLGMTPDPTIGGWQSW